MSITQREREGERDKKRGERKSKKPFASFQKSKISLTFCEVVEGVLGGGTKISVP